MEQFTSLEEFIISRWNSFSEFSEYLNSQEKLILDGEGAIYIQSNINNFLYKDAFFLFQINGKLYGTSYKENRETKKKYFDGIYQLDVSLLKSNTFKEAQQQNYNTKFKMLGVIVEVECKYYGYGNEHKLLFSKSGKIDLLYSHQLNIIPEDNSAIVKAQAFPSLKQVVQWQKMVDEVNARTEKILAAKKQK